MAEHLAYTTAKRKKQVIEFNLDGEDYHFTVPKRAHMVLPVVDADEDSVGVAALKAEYDWLGRGLAEGESDRLIAKLHDDSDDFDTDDLEKIYEWILKQVNGRPTG